MKLGRNDPCLEGYDADPRPYTTSVGMPDLDHVRSAPGYEIAL